MDFKNTSEVQNELVTHFENYISTCTYSKQLRPKTIKGYCDVFRTFQKIMPEVQELKDLHADRIHDFFKRICTRKQLINNQNSITIKPSTIKTYYNKLIVFFRWLETSNYIEKGSLTNTIIKPPEPTYEDDRALSEVEVSKIISSITLDAIHNPFLYARNLLMVSILLYTGVRKGELLGLRVHDIDFFSKTLFINGQTSKSKKSRKIPLHPTLVMHLKNYLVQRKKREAQCEYLILSNTNDKALTEHGLKHWVQKYKQLSGVAFHIHRFRHTFACNLAKNKADIVSIKNVMGHSSIKMTERYLRSIGLENARSFINSLSF